MKRIIYSLALIVSLGLNGLANAQVASHVVVLNIPNGDQYVGEIDDRERPHGDGTYTFVDGSTYKGHFKAGKYDGYGVFTWSTGDRYEGNWKKGVSTGEGRYISAYGYIFTPFTKWEKGSCTGKGMISFGPGETYSGDIVNAMMDGNGLRNFADGRVYEGQFKNGHINGKGKMLYPDRSYYDGAWVNDMQQGMGTFVDANLHATDGQYSMGQLVQVIREYEMVETGKK